MINPSITHISQIRLSNSHYLNSMHPIANSSKLVVYSILRQHSNYSFLELRWVRGKQITQMKDNSGPLLAPHRDKYHRLEYHKNTVPISLDLVDYRLTHNIDVQSVSMASPTLLPSKCCHNKGLYINIHLNMDNQGGQMYCNEKEDV